MKKLLSAVSAIVFVIAMWHELAFGHQAIWFTIMPIALFFALIAPSIWFIK